MAEPSRAQPTGDYVAKQNQGSNRALLAFKPSKTEMQQPRKQVLARAGIGFGKRDNALNIFYTLEGMFILNPRESARRMEEPAILRTVYPSLDGAIEAALKGHMDLDKATIEKENVTTASVNQWISVRIAGGLLREGK